MTVANMAGALGGGPSGGVSLQIATVTQVGPPVLAKIDGASTAFTLKTDVARAAATVTRVGDRYLVARVGSQVYEVSVISRGP